MKNVVIIEGDINKPAWTSTCLEGYKLKYDRKPLANNCFKVERQLMLPNTDIAESNAVKD